MAGLTAAYELRRRGAEVRVIEARARLGGRVHTIRNSFRHDQHAEAGGELIEEEHAAVQELARRLRLSTEPALKRGFGQYIARRNGRGIVASESTTWEAFERYFARACDEYARAEYALFRSVRAHATGRTVLIITHRLASVRQADRIYVLHEGRVTEQGVHTELMAAGGRYAELYSLQASQYGPVR